MTREVRAREHYDGDWVCLRKQYAVYFCFDCKVFVPTDKHVCDVLPDHPPGHDVTSARRQRARRLNKKRQRMVQ